MTLGSVVKGKVEETDSAFVEGKAQKGGPPGDELFVSCGFVLRVNVKIPTRQGDVWGTPE